MSLIDLVSIIPPPHEPLEVGICEQWTRVEESLGVSLPVDFREVCATYGSGWFPKICLYNPYSERYTHLVREVCQVYRLRKYQEGKAVVPFDLFPDHPGLLPCAGNDEDGEMFYFTDGPADTWPLILFDRGTGWQRLEVSITEFLLQTYTLELACIWWDKDWQTENFGKPEFIPTHL